MHKTYPEAAMPYAEAGVEPMPGSYTAPDVIGITVVRGLYFAEDGMEQVKRQQAAAQAAENERAAAQARRDAVVAERELQKQQRQQET